MYYILYNLEEDHHSLIKNIKDCFNFEWKAFNFADYKNKTGELKKEILDSDVPILILLWDLNLLEDEFSEEDIFQEEALNNITQQYFFFNYNNSESQKDFITNLAKEKLKNTSKIFLFGNKNQRDIDIDADVNREIIVSIFFLLNQHIFDLEYDNDFNYYLQNERVDEPEDKIVTFVPSITLIDIHSSIEAEFFNIFEKKLEKWFERLEDIDYRSYTLPNVHFNEIDDVEIAAPQIKKYNSLANQTAKDILSNKNSLIEEIRNYFDKLINIYIQHSPESFNKLNDIARNLLNNKIMNLLKEFVSDVKPVFFKSGLNLSGYKNFLTKIIGKVNKDRIAAFENYFNFDDVISQIEIYFDNLLNSAKKLFDFQSSENVKKYFYIFLAILGIIFILSFIIINYVFSISIIYALKHSITLSFILSIILILIAYFRRYFKLKRTFESDKNSIIRLINQKAAQSKEAYPKILKNFTTEVFQLKAHRDIKNILFGQLKIIGDIETISIRPLKYYLTDLLPDKTDYINKIYITSDLKRNISKLIKKLYPGKKIEDIVKTHLFSINNHALDEILKDFISSFLYDKIYVEISRTPEIKDIISNLNIIEMSETNLLINTSAQIRPINKAFDYSFSIQDNTYNPDKTTIKILAANYKVYHINDFHNESN